MSISKTLADFYIRQHKSCGGCQSRWKNMRKNFNINQAPEFLAKKAKSNAEIAGVLDTLFKEKKHASV
tara:strand:+ start:76 stop:279 length:204 start_codon:yes stop_codon:yes gene_type:complete